MNQILDILRGIVIGIANIIPGVSGGTMAVSMGIYDKLIGAVTGLFRHFKDSSSPSCSLSRAAWPSALWALAFC